MPAWLKWDDNLDKPVLVEERVAIVRRIFKMAVAGYGTMRIAKTLDAEGVPAMGQGDKWVCTSVSKLFLRNITVIGHYEMREKKRPTGEVIKNVYPAAIDEKTYYTVQKNLRERKHATTPTKAVSHNLVTGLVRCPTCDGTMVHHRQICYGTKVYSYLLCAPTSQGKRGDKPCKMTVKYDLFENSLLGLLSQS